jgi:hypothetical protein
MAVATDCGFEILSHPPYSLDLVPSDFSLFSDYLKYIGPRTFKLILVKCCWHAV